MPRADLPLDPGYHGGDGHASPSNEDPTRDIVEAPLGSASTPWCIGVHGDS